MCPTMASTDGTCFLRTPNVSQRFADVGDRGVLRLWRSRGAARHCPKTHSAVAGPVRPDPAARLATAGGLEYQQAAVRLVGSATPPYRRFRRGGRWGSARLGRCPLPGMDEALEPVRAARERAGCAARARRHAGGLEDVVDRAFRHGLETEQLVELGDAAAAERRYFAERVEFAAPVGGDDRPACVQLQLPRSEPPRRRLAHRDQLADELVERDAAVLDAGSLAEYGVEGLGVAVVEYLHAPVARAGPRGRRQHERGENRTDRRDDGNTPRAHIRSYPCPSNPG